MDVSIQDQVIADLEARKELGFSKYGTLLYTKNGRSFAQDLYEELLDAACYLKGMMLEADGPEPQGLDLDALWDCSSGTIVKNGDGANFCCFLPGHWIEIDVITRKSKSTSSYTPADLVKRSPIILVELP